VSEPKPELVCWTSLIVGGVKGWLWK